MGGAGWLVCGLDFRVLATGSAASSTACMHAKWPTHMPHQHRTQTAVFTAISEGLRPGAVAIN